MATHFYDSFGQVLPKGDDRHQRPNPGQEAESFRFAIYFGVANTVFSITAFFLVENKPSPPVRIQRHSRASSVSSFSSADYPQGENGHRNNSKIQLRGRRFLLLTSLAAGVITLLLTATMFSVRTENPRRSLIIFFTIVFTAFYSPGAGAIPFLYCAEIFPNEGRELGMSWSTFCNFLGAGVLAFSVPFGRDRGLGQLLGLFSGFNAIAFALVWFFVPGTNHTATLEDMSYVFGRRMRDHASTQAKRLWPGTTSRGGPNFQWRNGGEDSSEQPSGGIAGE